VKFWTRLILLWLLFGVTLRGVFLWFYPIYAVQPGLSGFVFGALNDLQAFGLVAGIIAVFAGAGERLWRWAAFIVLAVVLLVGVAELFFWFEFESRLDRLVFHYLTYPKEVIVFLQDQFYLTFFALPFLAVTWLLMHGISWPRAFERAPVVHGVLMVCGGVVLLVGQPVGQSNSRIASEFASNGYLGVLTDARYTIDNIVWLAGHDHGQATPHLQLDQTTLAQAVRQELAGKRHVVLIIEESFGGKVWDDENLRERYLPNLARLAESSVNFSHMYATGSRTTRGMEALLNGFPPLPGISTTERDRFPHLPSLARAMAEGGYYPVFLYGGWPDFSNFSNYWQASGFQKIWSREDFDEEFETSWGVADGALLERLLLEMSALTKQQDRVFLSTLTVSHHRPYDFPGGSVEFPTSDRVREYAIAYADQALGDFFTAARQQPWYADTLFIVAADHGVHPRGDALIPASSYRIPLLLHADGLQPRLLTGMSSSMSLPKTLMSALQIDTKEPFAGADLLCQCDTVVPVEFGYNIGLLEREGLRVIRADGTYANWQFDPATNRLGAAQDGLDVDSARRVKNAFAPFYQWFYSQDPTGTQISTDVNDAQVVR
jgi:phosphoglycerol transferase MdoB-like AlkP superfamily enzyme